MISGTTRSRSGTEAGTVISRKTSEFTGKLRDRYRAPECTETPPSTSKANTQRTDNRGLAIERERVFRRSCSLPVISRKTRLFTGHHGAARGQRRGRSFPVKRANLWESTVIATARQECTKTPSPTSRANTQCNDSRGLTIERERVFRRSCSLPVIARKTR